MSREDPILTIDAAKPGCISRAVKLHGEVFKTDPVLQFLVYTSPVEMREDFIYRLMEFLLPMAARNRARFDEAWTRAHDENPPATSAIWVPPGHKVDSLRSYLSLTALRIVRTMGAAGTLRMLGEYQSEANGAKKRALVHPRTGARQAAFWYLFFLSTDPKDRGLRLASQLIERMQAQAESEGLPIWLESTTSSSHALYLRLGFVDEFSWVLGKGRVNANGVKEDDGAGVPVWGMIWWPQSMRADSEQKGKETGTASDK